MSTQGLETVLLAQGELTCFHHIRELTRNHRVAVGHDNAVVRWEPSDKDDQKWLIVPAGTGGACKLYNLERGLVLSVHSGGELFGHDRETGESDQLFRFVNHQRSDGSYNMREHTRDEYVGVGSVGRLVRWAATGQKDQRFVLEPIDVRRPDRTEPGKLRGQKPVPADQIELPKPLEGLRDQVPATTGEILVGVDIVPSALVEDPNFTSRIHQVKEHPYYHLAHHRFWKKITDKTLARGVKDTVKAVAFSGSTEVELDQMETTLGVVVTGKVGGKAKKVSASLSAKFSYQKKELHKHETKREERREETKQIEVSRPEDSRIVAWQIVDRFTLYDSDEREVRTWEVYESEVDAVHWASYPHDAVSGG